MCWRSVGLAIVLAGCASDDPDGPLGGDGLGEDSEEGDGSGVTSGPSSSDDDPSMVTSGQDTEAESGSTPTSDASGTGNTDDPGETGDGGPDSGERDCGPGTCDAGEYCVDGVCEGPPPGMVAVPAGTFSMGCADEVAGLCAADEFPFHDVDLDAFAVDETEVTVAAYTECIDAGECPPLPALDDQGNTCDYDPDDLPVTCIDWFNARDYCEFAGKRLPTEAEWEKAARGEDAPFYPWGDEPPTCDRAVYSGCGGTASVGSKPQGASPYGALDMAGNVFEWVADWYSATYYSVSPGDNPTGPAAGTRRAIRSSAANYLAETLRASFRGVSFEVPTPDDAHVNVGFRCAVTP